ncbi:MAG: hypothetical protein Kow0098_15020 [Ignavibacteriaceae bacterium]
MTGKAITLLVLGFSAITFLLILKLNANSMQGLDSTIDHFENTQARLIANSGVEIFLEKLRRDKDMEGEYPDNKLFDGTYDISITGPDTALVIVSKGYFGEREHETIVKATRIPVEIPPIYGALYVSSSTMNLNLNGNLIIDGNDTNPDGSEGTEDAMPGIAVDDPADSAFVINDLKPKIANDIEGLGGAPSVYTRVDTTDWLQITQDIIFAADITLGTGTYSSGTVLGTPTEPKITFVNGSVHFSGDAVGDGIMVINGDVTMSGNFTYRGIIIVYGESSIETDIVGNGGVYGSTILVGEEVDIHATGNASFYYSSTAINNAELNLKSSRFSITSWWE